MANRYIWSRYSLSASQVAFYPDDNISAQAQVKPDSSNRFWSWGGSETRGYTLQNGPIYFLYGNSYSISNGKFVISSPTTQQISNGTTASTNLSTNYQSVGLGSLTDISGTRTVYFGISKTNTNAFDVLYKWAISYSRGTITKASMQLQTLGGNGSSDKFIVQWNEGLYVGVEGNGYAYKLGKGSANGTTSNASSTAYPPRSYASKSARIWP